MKRVFNSFIFAILPCVGMLGCLPSSSELVLRQVSSSDYTATLSKRNSGAMSRGSTLVSVRGKAVPDNDTHGVIVFGASYGAVVDMKWIDPKHLELSCSSCTVKDVNFEVVKASDVLISYDNNLRVQ
jgi:hypothetical protein